MSTPTDEWMVTVLEDSGVRRRFVIHHQPVKNDFTSVAAHALTTACVTYRGRLAQPGRWIQILSIVNQEAP